MKKLIVLFVAVCFGFALQAQTVATAPAAATTTAKKVQTQNPAAYACPKCFMVSKGAGQCAMCKTDKVQLGTYFCPKCMKSAGAKAGTCADCKGATVQMTRKYCAANGGTPLRTGKEKAAKAVDPKG